MGDRLSSQDATAVATDFLAFSDDPGTGYALVHSLELGGGLSLLFEKAPPKKTDPPMLVHVVLEWDERRWAPAWATEFAREQTPPAHSRGWFHGSVLSTTFGRAPEGAIGVIADYEGRVLEGSVQNGYFQVVTSTDHFETPWPRVRRFEFRSEQEE
jgi:hypothetical protein